MRVQNQPNPPENGGKLTRRERKAQKKAQKKAAKQARKEYLRNASWGVRARNTALNIITWCLVGILIFSGYKVGTTVWEYMKARNAYSNISKTADAEEFTGIVDFDALKEINPDVQGWLYQEDTIINYPVVQGTDNDKYLYTRFDKEYSGGGTLFVDYRCEPDFEGFHTIIYGHHMRDGSMFHSLRGYTKEDGYYEDHKTFELLTPDWNYHLVIFSAYITEATSDAYAIDFADDAAKQQFIDDAFRNSAISVTSDDVDVTPDDRIVTLSTCAYDFDQARYVVICKAEPWTKSEMKEGEALKGKIDADKVS